MDPTELRARCEARLADVHIPSPFDLAVLCAELGRRRGRPIALLSIAMDADGPSGLWISGSNADYIVYEQATTPLHQTHIALHELGHLLCGHESGTPVSGADVDRLFTQLDPRLVHSALGRTSYSNDDESEAELLASLILQRAEVRTDPVGSRVVDPATARSLRHLGRSL
jgi:Zn-dependent peptidase ImmA (M78 family)